MNKLKSRKLWIAIMFGIFAVINETVQLGVSQEVINKVKEIVMMYLGVEGGIDLIGRFKNA